MAEADLMDPEGDWPAHEPMALGQVLAQLVEATPSRGLRSLPLASDEPPSDRRRRYQGNVGSAVGADRRQQ